MSTLAAQIDAFVQGAALVKEAVSGISREQALARPVPGRWSTQEVVCHLNDSDQAWIHRMKRVIAEDKPLLIGYDETRFAASLGYHQRNLADELTMLEQGRRQMASILRSLPQEAFARVGVHSERGLVTLEQMIALEIQHIAHHLKFIREKRQALGLPTG